MTTQSPGTAPREHGVVFQLESKSKNVSALGAFESADPSSKAFRVYAGSTGALEAASSMAPSNVKRRNELIQAGVLVRRDSCLELSSDHEFKSPSAAASVLLANSASGPLQWRTHEGTSLKDWLKERPRLTGTSSEANTGSKPTDMTLSDEQRESIRELFVLSTRKGVEAKGYFTDPADYYGKFTIIKGAIAATDQGTSMPRKRAQLYENLVAHGTIAMVNGKPTFQHDHEFRSALHAIEVLCRRACSDGREWRNEASKRLIDIRTGIRRAIGSGTEQTARRQDTDSLTDGATDTREAQDSKHGTNVHTQSDPEPSSASPQLPRYGVSPKKAL